MFFFFLVLEYDSNLICLSVVYALFGLLEAEIIYLTYTSTYKILDISLNVRKRTAHDIGEILSYG